MDRLTLVLALLLASASALAQQRFPPEIWPDRPTPASEQFLEGILAELRGDMTAAIELHTRAARNGDGKAAYRMGEIYDFGIGGATRDYREALKWYNAARALGYSGRPIPIAFRNAREAEIAGKTDEAISLYEDAARAGDSNAAERLARIHGAAGAKSAADKWRAIARRLLEQRYFIEVHEQRLDRPKGGQDIPRYWR